MSMTEMAKQLAKRKNEESESALDRKIARMEREDFQNSVVTEITRQFAPLSEGINIQRGEVRRNMEELTRMTKIFHEEFRGAIKTAAQAGEELREQNKGITTKLWVVMLLTSSLVGALSAYACLKISPRFSTDREVVLWRAFQDQFRHLTPEKGKKVEELLFSNTNPKR